jgi:hypothetical protein
VALCNNERNPEVAGPLEGIDSDGTKGSEAPLLCQWRVRCSTTGGRKAAKRSATESTESWTHLDAILEKIPLTLTVIPILSESLFLSRPQSMLVTFSGVMANNGRT